jgi:hypothetical protein
MRVFLLMLLLTQSVWEFSLLTHDLHLHFKSSAKAAGVAAVFAMASKLDELVQVCIYKIKRT